MSTRFDQTVAEDVYQADQRLVNQRIRRSKRRRRPRSGANQAAVAVAFDGLGAESGHGVGVAAVDGGLCHQAQGPADGELVGRAAAECGAGDAAAQDPQRVRAGAVAGLGQVGEVGEVGLLADDVGYLSIRAMTSRQ